MASQSQFEAMVIPKGARILVGEGAEIELDVQGDLVLQESQRGLKGLKSHHGSILIDEGVQVNSRAINAKHMIRVRGRLETEHLHATAIQVDGGSIRCSTLQTDELTCVNGNIETSTVEAKKVRIKGGHVEIGSISTTTLNLEDKVRGSILISHAKERKVDETVQIKGGFESDVELLGYLLKYRHQIMSDRVLKELKARKEGREFKRFLIEEAGVANGVQPNRENILNVDTEPVFKDELGNSELIEDPFPVSADDNSQSDSEFTDELIKGKLAYFSDALSKEIPDQNAMSAMIKLILASLRQGDVQTLGAIYKRWSGNLEEETNKLSDSARALIYEIRDYLKDIV